MNPSLEIDIKNLLRPHIRDLVPYSSARDEYTGKVGVFLDANENPEGSVIAGKHNRYPDPLQRELKARIAEIKGVHPERIFLGNGSDEAIDLLFRAFCEPGKDKVLLLPPTYGMYKVSAAINGVEIENVPLTKDYQIDLGAVLNKIDTVQPKLIFLCSPNNPTGNTLSRDAMRSVIERASGLVIVDEAYVDFSSEGSLLQADLTNYHNLMVLQTFSKAWGLANLRVGMAFADPAIIAVLNKIKAPYNLSGVTQDLALEAVNKHEAKNKMVSEILANREWLKNELKEIPLVEHIYPTEANFLLVKVPDADELYSRLIGDKIIVRNRSRVQNCEGCLRISVGTREENEQLIDALKLLS